MTGEHTPRLGAAGLLLVLLVPATGCFDPSAADCSSGTAQWYCPATYSCHPRVHCVSPAQILACQGKADTEPCATATIDVGHCDTGACLPGTCGDGVTDDGEQCDDGLANSDTEPDVCRIGCYSPGCGDGVLDLGEACDDANTDGGDGCAADCRSTEECGNGIQDVGEECDAGQYNSTIPDAPCRPSCLRPMCGDGITDVLAHEECDDASANSDVAPDACREDCTTHRCGDGVIDANEACDDGNSAPGDGCAADCSRFEYGWNCDAAPPHHCVQCPTNLHGANCDQCAVLVDHRNTSANHNGANWYAAYPRVQQGINKAAALIAGPDIDACDVWVSQGTYSVYETSADDTIALASHVGVYGGFTGVERARTERDAEQHVTTLSGGDSGLLHRVLHVVSAYQVEDAVVDGVVITGGHAVGTGVEDVGAGLFVQESRVRVAHSVITQNIAEASGAGVYNLAMERFSESHLELDHCVVADNDARSGGGVASYAFDGTASVTATDCLFSTNTVSGNGGGLYSYAGEGGSKASVTLARCAFTRNDATNAGGGVYTGANRGKSTAVLRDCTLSDNHADYGGGVYNYASFDVATLSLTECTLENNRTDFAGGGVLNNAYFSTANATLSGCILRGNYGGSEGGGVHNTADFGFANLSLHGCAVYMSYAANGGGAYNYADVSSAQATLVSRGSTFAHNSAWNGGALYSIANNAGASADQQISSSILWGNTADTAGWQILLDTGGEPSTIAVDHSTVQGGWGGTGNTDQDPLFVSSAEPYDHHLQQGSPSIDTGDDSTSPITDLEGRLRVDIAGVGATSTLADMGAYEYNGSPSNPVTAYGGSLYWESGAMIETQGNAATYCSQFGGSLVTIADQLENDLVQSLGFNVAWMGAYHDTGTTWLWPGGGSVSWDHWTSGAPDGSSGACATIDPATGLWSDAACATVLPFLCEQPAF